MEVNYRNLAATTYKTPEPQVRALKYAVAFPKIQLRS